MVGMGFSEMYDAIACISATKLVEILHGRMCFLFDTYGKSVT